MFNQPISSLRIKLASENTSEFCQKPTRNFSMMHSWRFSDSHINTLPSLAWIFRALSYLFRAKTTVVSRAPKRPMFSAFRLVYVRGCTARVRLVVPTIRNTTHRFYGPSIRNIYSQRPPTSPHPTPPRRNRGLRRVVPDHVFYRIVTGLIIGATVVYVAW